MELLEALANARQDTGIAAVETPVGNRGHNVGDCKCKCGDCKCGQHCDPSDCNDC